MRTFLATLAMLLCSIGASATSYAVGQQGSFFWEASSNSGGWSMRIPDLPYYLGVPGFTPHYRYPTAFSTANMSVTCSSVCAIGKTFSFDLTMSNFTLTGHAPYLYPDTTMFVGTLTLLSKPILLQASNGTALAHFTMTGDLLGCPDVTCSNPEFSLTVNLHGPLAVAYTLSGGQVSIGEIGYYAPEPSSIALLGTGAVLLFGKVRKSVRRKSAPATL
jgi:hypothetical protein